MRLTHQSGHAALHSPDHPVFDGRLASIILKIDVDGCLPWLLLAFARFPPPTEGDIWERHVVVPPAVRSLGVEIDRLRHGRSQSRRAGEHQETESSNEGVV